MRDRRPLRACAFALGATLALIATACGHKSSDPGNGSGASPPSPPRRNASSPAGTRGLELRVSEGKQGAPAYDRAKLAPAQPLAAADVQALLSRAQPLAAEPGDAQSFAFRPRSQPAPRTGTQIAGSFPPPPSSLAPPPSSTAGDKLAVVRWMPEGAVPLAPELSVTFSQPMVAVTSQADAAATTPVKLTPQPAGKWRWIGTRTIVFDPEVRFPQATTYQVEIPAGTRSATGGALAAATRFSFETPPPSVVSSYPATGQPHPLDVPMLLVFDQKIDAAAVLAKLKLTANGRAVQLRAIDAAELARAATGTRRDKELAARIEAEKQDGRDGRWVAFRALQPLPVDAAIELEVPAGTPSAEGPNRTKTPQRFAFRTFPPLRVVRHECGYGGTCSPGMPLHIQLNNPLDPEAFDPSWVSVQPEIPGMRVMPGHDAILVQGATEARTTYTVALASALRDDFGQTLGKRAALDWRVGDAQPTFFGPTGLVVLDPSAKRPTLDFFTTNYAQLKVKLYQVDVADYPAFLVYLRDQWNHDKPPVPPGKKVFDGEVATNAGSNKLAETSIDLSPALPGGLGHAIAVVEPSPWGNAYQPPRMISWVQSTRLGIDAYVDADQLIGFATDLETGAPASGVALELRPFGTQATTDASGLATIALSPTGTTGPQLLVARRGQDVAFVSEREAYWADQGTWIKQSRPATLAWYVVDDRKTYKPGEQVSLKGWARAIEQARNGDITGPGGTSSLSFVVRDARGNQIATGAAKVDAVGGFDAQFALPKTPNLGTASILFDAVGETGGQYVHSFEIQEFRRPEFEVTAQASQGPFLVGGSGDVTVAAKYYAGGPLPGADVRWLVQAQPTTFTPPNRDDYVFGEWLPWWGYRDRGGFHGGRSPGGKVWELAGKTDATGAHPLHLDFLSVEPAAPMSVVATASVSDVNRQTWSASATSIVHPSSLYVGLEMKRPFVEKGVPFELGVIGVDL
ncbi:MAG: Ig-like domain-containing protein, partial [Kofleriaceae bacterium]